MDLNTVKEYLENLPTSIVVNDKDYIITGKTLNFKDQSLDLYYDQKYKIKYSFHTKSYKMIYAAFDYSGDFYKINAEPILKPDFLKGQSKKSYDYALGSLSIIDADGIVEDVIIYAEDCYINSAIFKNNFDECISGMLELSKGIAGGDSRLNEPKTIHEKLNNEYILYIVEKYNLPYKWMIENKRFGIKITDNSIFCYDFAQFLGGMSLKAS